MDERKSLDERNVRDGYLAYTTDVGMLQLKFGAFADMVIGQVGYERQTERRYDCRVLGDGCLGGVGLYI